MLDFIVGKGLAVTLGIGASLAAERIEALRERLAYHFSLSSHDLALAFQEAFRKGMSSMAVGAVPRAWEDWGGLRDRVLASRVTREYAAPLETRVFGPYADSRGLSQDDLLRLRWSVARQCRDLSRRAGDVLPVDAFPDGRRALALMRRDVQEDLGPHLMAKITDAGIHLPEDVIDLLSFRGLAGDAVLFFLRDTLRRDERVRLALDLIRQDAVADGLERTEAEVVTLGTEFRQFSDLCAAMPDALTRLEETLDSQLGEVVTDLGVVRDQTQAIWSLLNDIALRLSDHGRGLDIRADHALDPVFATEASVIVQVRALLSSNRETVRGLRGAANTIAASLVSTGDSQRVADAERLLEEALETADVPSEKAQIAHNLFHVRLLGRSLEAALDPLLMAIDLDPARYAPCSLIHANTLKYPVRGLLGVGGMGCVFLCDEPVRRRHVALKVLWKESPTLSSELFTEFQVMDAIGGGIVPQVYDYGLTPGGNQPYIVMECLDGFLDGEVWLSQRGPLTVEETARIGARIARALAVAHQRKPDPLPHLDLKPANLMLRNDDGTLAVRVIDWGLAGRASPKGHGLSAQGPKSTTVLGKSIFAGTLEYAAPEQWSSTDFGAPGPKSDVYALGKTLYRLATGAPAHTVSPRLRSNLGFLAELIDNCIEVNPKDRPDAEMVAESLERHLGADAEAPKTGSADTGLSSRQTSRRTDPGEDDQTPEDGPEPLPWAHATGHDRFGRWADIAVEATTGKPVIQRLRWIPPGRFLMGSPEDEPGRSQSEGPQHEVTLEHGFWLFDTPCTQALWQAVMGENPSEFKSPDRPVETVSWNDAQTFLQRINERVPDLTLTLPSEAQWEYACRAGTTSARYPNSHRQSAQTWTDRIAGFLKGELDGIAWFDANSERQTHPVSQKLPNAWGLHDMLGNVWEWCADHWHDSYDGAPVDGSAWLDDGADTGASRVIRGGSWYFNARYVRAAFRFRYHPNERFIDLGFRCSRVQS